MLLIVRRIGSKKLCSLMRQPPDMDGKKAQRLLAGKRDEPS